MLSLGTLPGACSTWPTAAALLAMGITSRRAWQYALPVHTAAAQPALMPIPTSWSTIGHGVAAVAEVGTGYVIPLYANQSRLSAYGPRMFSTTPLGSFQNDSSDEQAGNGQLHLLKSRHETQSPISQASRIFKKSHSSHKPQ